MWKLGEKAQRQGGCRMKPFMPKTRCDNRTWKCNKRPTKPKQLSRLKRKISSIWRGKSQWSSQGISTLHDGHVEHGSEPFDPKDTTIQRFIKP